MNSPASAAARPFATTMLRTASATHARTTNGVTAPGVPDWDDDESDDDNWDGLGRARKDALREAASRKDAQPGLGCGAMAWKQMSPKPLLRSCVGV